MATLIQNDFVRYLKDGEGFLVVTSVEVEGQPTGSFWTPKQAKMTSLWTRHFASGDIRAGTNETWQL